MSIVYAERPVAFDARPQSGRADSRSYWLESFDRSKVVRFDNAPVSLLRGAVGLEDAPVGVIEEFSPGVEGSSVGEVQTLSRSVLLPVAIYGSSQAVVWAAKDRLKAVVSPGSVVTGEGSFRLVCTSASGSRELTLVYRSGLEGETRVPNYDKFALNLLAPDPFARDRDARSVEFSLGSSTHKMVSANPGTAGPRGLGSSVVIGESMPVDIVSGIPVYPRIDVTGPFDPLTMSASTGLSLSMPGGVPAGSTFTAVLDPRNRSFRLDGALAAGMIARGSKVGRPFLPGVNNLSVAASGATEESRIVLSWRGGWRSLW